MTYRAARAFATGRILAERKPRVADKVALTIDADRGRMIDPGTKLAACSRTTATVVWICHGFSALIVTAFHAARAALCATTGRVTALDWESRVVTDEVALTINADRGSMIRAWANLTACSRATATVVGICLLVYALPVAAGRIHA
jgi:hypothetical protein